MQLPILYSFRRCPYAMRARMAMNYSKISYEHREISLRKRPQALYDISAKGTVPVLQLPDGLVIDESIDIMRWALKKSDPESWYKDKIPEQDNMIERNDTVFKYWLDRYKYHVRYPENSFEEYQTQLEKFYLKYNLQLDKNTYLLGNHISLVDIAIMPFIRQAAHVNLDWFSEKFPKLHNWLENHKTSKIFKSIMEKYDIWNEQEKGLEIIQNR
mgnify:FL=1